MKKLAATLICISIFSSAQAEIKQIIIRWNAMLCLDICTPGLEANLQSLKGATHVEVNPRGGIAVINWGPNVPFSYDVLNFATKGAGVTLTDIRLKVTGTITHDSSGFYLNSLGDNTRFLLLGSINTQEGRYTIDPNAANHPLSPELQQELLDAENNGLVATIEGPLFNYWTYNLNLIADHVSISKPKNDPRLSY